VVLVVVAVLNIFVGRGDRNFMRWLPLICLLQYFLVIPHELGHALVARFWGYEQIRIFVGWGKPLFAGNFLGFPWMFRMVPFGGVTTAKPGP
jgi:membrane-associated protease RseP (regulator of RpoE activity)